MRYNLYFDFTAFCITFVILIAARIQKWIPTYQNRSYRSLVLCVCLTALLDFFSCGFENWQLNSRTWYLPAKYFFDSGYHFFHITTGMFFLHFACSILSSYPDTRKKKLAAYGPMILIYVLLLVNLFVPCLFSYDREGTYTRGALMPVIYLAGIYYLGFSIVLILKNRKRLSRSVTASMTRYIAMTFAGIAIQTVFPQYMVGEFFNTLALIMMYINVETADEVKDKRYDVMSRDAFLKEARRSVAFEVPFQVIFLRIIDSHEMARETGRVVHMELNRTILRYLLEKYRNEAWIAVWDEQGFLLHLMDSSRERAGQIMREIEQRFNQRWITDNYSRSLGLTEWVMSYPQDFSTVQEMVRKTDILMDISLHRHRGIVQVSEMDFEALGFKRKMMEIAQEAITANTAETRYEPVLDVNTQEVVNARSVIFFADENGNMIRGSQFADSSVPSETIAAFDEYALAAAARNRTLLENPESRAAVSTRLSKPEISRSGFVKRLEHICEENGTTHRKMMLRISDSTYAQLSEAELRTLQEMEQDGWILSIDDFGFGQSFLSRLIDSPISYIFMHPRVTQSILSSERGIRLGKGVIGIIHGMNKTLTMTGIETKEQAETAAEMGADFYCGPYFHAPMKPEEYHSWIKARGSV